MTNQDAQASESTSQQRTAPRKSEQSFQEALVGNFQSGCKVAAYFAAPVAVVGGIIALTSWLGKSK